MHDVEHIVIEERQNNLSIICTAMKINISTHICLKPNDRRTRCNSNTINARRS